MDVTVSESSMSTDKLVVLMAGLTEFPAESFMRIKSVSIDWEHVSDDVIVPNLKLEYYEKA